MPSENSTSPLLLIVEDEKPMRKYLCAFLSGARYRVREASSGWQALSAAATEPPDLIVLDLGLPDMDGEEVLQRLREWFKGSIIILSVRNQDVQKVSALDHGADDYLVKPFSTSELLARIRVSLRRAAHDPDPNAAPIFEFRRLKVDLGSRRVYVRGSEVHLTPLEYKLLITLVHHAGKVLTHQFLLEQVWGLQKSEQSPHLRVFMASLRRKVEADPAQPKYLLTEQGIGYRLAYE
jgi:two-component system KDP operon response regulator KdpE